MGCADFYLKDYREYMVTAAFRSGYTLLTFTYRTILRSETLYPNPDVFYPDRFMEKVDQQTERRRDPRNYIFGFGRRYALFFPVPIMDADRPRSLGIVLDPI
jgi:hypothetical protein